MTWVVCGNLMVNAALAAPPEPLDPDFLDYLAQCENKDDNWTVVAADKDRKQTATPPAKPPAAADTPDKEAKP